MSTWPMSYEYYLGFKVCYGAGSSEKQTARRRMQQKPTGIKKQVYCGNSGILIWSRVWTEPTTSRRVLMKRNGIRQFLYCGSYRTWTLRQNLMQSRQEQLLLSILLMFTNQLFLEMSKAVSPLAFFIFLLAPQSNNLLTIRVLPQCAARCSGVYLFESTRSRSTLREMRRSVTRQLEEQAAQWTGVMPLLSVDTIDNLSLNFMKELRASAWAAKWSTFRPLLVTAAQLALSSRSLVMLSMLSLQAAQCRGVKPQLFAQLIQA